MFKEIAQKYPKSVYSDDLPYYEALARYRIGTTEELHTAVKLLEPRASKLHGVIDAVEQQQPSSLRQRRGTERRRRRGPLRPNQLGARSTRRP